MFLICFLVLVLGHADCLPKCCHFNEQMSLRNDGRYDCGPDGTMRLQILTPRTNSLRRNSSFECRDVRESGVAKFRIGDGAADFVEVLDGGEFRPKCCPWNYTYDFENHACIEGEVGQSEGRFDYEEMTLRIGLKHCQVIEDFRFEGDQTVYEELSGARIKLNGEVLGPDEYCMEQGLIRVCHDDLSICERKKCIYKCCPDGQSLVNGSNCRDTHTKGVNLTAIGNVEGPTDPYVIIHKRLDIIALKNNVFNFFQEHKIDSDGTLQYSLSNRTVRYQIGEQRYCIEHAYRKADAKKPAIDGYRLFGTFRKQEKPLPLKFSITRWVLIASCIFLVLTIVFNVISGKYRRLFGRLLICLCGNLTVLFGLLLYNAFSQPKDQLCTILGFITMYVSFSCFTWLNSMCLDTYKTFSSVNNLVGIHRQSEDRKQFLIYVVYGWGVPLILLLLIVVFFHVDVLPPPLRIHIGDKKCLIENGLISGNTVYNNKQCCQIFIFVVVGSGNYAEILFYIMPITIMEVTNIVLFLKTVSYYLKVKNDIDKMNDTNALTKDKKRKFMANKERLILIIKLFIIMGVSFLFDVISSFYNFDRNDVTRYIEVMWDVFNALLGVFIFIMFGYNKKTIATCARAFGMQAARRSSLSTFTQSTNFTRTSQKST